MRKPITKMTKISFLKIAPAETLDCHHNHYDYDDNVEFRVCDSASFIVRIVRKLFVYLKIDRQKTHNIIKH